MPATITVGAEFDANSGVAQTPVIPAGTLTGQLLLLITASVTTAATPPATPATYSILGDLTTTDPLIVFGKIAEAGETAPALAAWGSGQSCGYMVAIAPPAGYAWAAIGSINAVAATSAANGSATTGKYSAHTVSASNNVLYRVTVKNGTLGGTPTAIAVTSGYTAGGFANRGSSGLVAGEMLTALTTFGSDATAATPAITGDTASTNADGLTFEFDLVPTTTTTISIDDATPEPGGAIVITKAEGAFTGSVTVSLDDNLGAPVDVSAAVTGSGATRTLTLPALSSTTTVSSWDDSNATWEKIRWGQAITLTVQDDDGTDTDTITITPPVSDHFGTLAGGVFDYAPTGAADTDDCYVHVASGDGEGLPIIAGFQGNTVPCVVHFMTFDSSANKWLALDYATDNGLRQFNIATLTGAYADTFTAANDTVITDHTPTTNTVGGSYTIEKDVSTAAAVANAVTIQSDRVRINDPNEGFVKFVGTVEPDFSVDWVLQPGDTAKSALIHVRRVDDTEHVHVNFVQSSGLIRVNERVASVNIAITGDNDTTYTAGFLANTTYRLRVLVEGSVISVYVNDVLQVQCTSTRSPSSSATKVGVFSSGGAGAVPVYFDDANCETDYSGVRTLTFSDSTPSPGDTITCTVVGSDFAGTIDVCTINGIAVTPSGADLNSCNITIPTIGAYDAAGAHAVTPWAENIEISIGDGVGVAAVSTIQITAPVPANYAVVGSGALVYPPVGTETDMVAYVHVVSGAGTADASRLNFIATESSEVWFMVYDPSAISWLARREQSVSRVALAYRISISVGISII